jgi:hypothetical protein
MEKDTRVPEGVITESDVLEELIKRSPILYRSVTSISKARDHIALCLARGHKPDRLMQNIKNSKTESMWWEATNVGYSRGRTVAGSPEL